MLLVECSKSDLNLDKVELLTQYVPSLASPLFAALNYRAFKVVDFLAKLVGTQTLRVGRIHISDDKSNSLILARTLLNYPQIQSNLPFELLVQISALNEFEQNDDFEVADCFKALMEDSRMTANNTIDVGGKLRYRVSGYGVLHNAIAFQNELLARYILDTMNNHSAYVGFHIDQDDLFEAAKLALKHCMNIAVRICEELRMDKLAKIIIKMSDYDSDAYVKMLNGIDSPEDFHSAMCTAISDTVLGCCSFTIPQKSTAIIRIINCLTGPMEKNAIGAIVHHLTQGIMMNTSSVLQILQAVRNNVETSPEHLDAFINAMEALRPYVNLMKRSNTDDIPDAKRVKTEI